MKQLIHRAFLNIGYDIRRYPGRMLRSRIALFNFFNISILFDVGANVGQYASEMRKIGYKGKIVSFEPILEAYEQLEKLVNKDKHWISSQIALGDFESVMDINVSGNIASSSLLNITRTHTDEIPQTKTVRKEQIIVRKLDDIVNDYVSDRDRLFVKIDTQGFEKKVIEGALSSLDRICGFQLELSLVEMYKGESLFLEMIMYMENIGYQLYSIEPGFYNSNTGRLYQCDAFFYKH